MDLRIQLLVLTVVLAVFCSPAGAENCQLTAFEKNAARSISFLRANPIWRDFPTRHIFAVREFEASTPGFYVVLPQERDRLLLKGLAKACRRADLVQSSEPLTRTRGQFYASCSAADLNEGCLEIPHFRKVWDVLQQAVGVIGIAKEHFEQLSASIRAIPYTALQLRLYHGIHEMFHTYQVEQKWKTSFDSGKQFPHCMEEPAWKKSFESEVRWWGEKIAEIHQVAKNPKALSALLKEYYAQVRPPSDSECDGILARYQFLEGVPHFVGSVALLKAGLAREEELALIDQHYLRVSFDEHNVMGVYVSGGALSWALYYLMGEQFIDEIEKSRTPYEIGRSLLNPK